jgi:hypothetical protein
MAIEDRIGTDIDYNKDKLEVEGDPLEIITPGQEDVITEFVEDEKGNMQPLADAEKPQEDFNSNLANFLSDEQLDNISIELMSAIKDDQSSREDWETQYTKGLDLVGFKYEEEPDHSEERLQLLILYYQRLLFNFSHKHIKNYYLPMVLLKHKLLVSLMRR